MPFYDTRFNRVLVTVTRPEERQHVYEHLKDRLNSVHVHEPDAQGRIDIGIDQAPNEDAAKDIRQILGREWPDSADWIEVDVTQRPVSEL